MRAPNESPWYHYIITRVDMPKEWVVCQVAHACLEAVASYGTGDGAHVVVLSVAGLPELLEAGARLARAGIRFALFSESHDNTGPTALCSAPVAGKDRVHFQGYPLLRWTHEEATCQEARPTAEARSPSQEEAREGEEEREVMVDLSTKLTPSWVT